MTLAFDTLTYASKLQAAGFTEEQARAQAEALAGIVADTLATKADIAALQRDVKELETALKRDVKELETVLKRDIKELETALKRDLKELETALRREIAAVSDKLTIRLGGMLVVGIAVLAALLKLL